MENQMVVSLRRKVGISILCGLISLLLSPYGIVTTLGEVHVNIPWSLFLPILAALAYGWRFGLLAGLSGGALFPFLLWQNNGWANIGTTLIFAGSYVLLGLFKDKNHFTKLENTPLRISIALSLSILSNFLYDGFLFNKLLSFNPTFWEAKTINNVPQELLWGIAFKDSINLVILVIASETFLQLSFIRSLMGIPSKPASKANLKIFIATISTFFFVWLVYIGLAAILIKADNSMHNIYYSLALLVFLASSFIVAIILFYYNETQVIIKDRLNKSKGKFKALFENANDGIFIMRDATIIECNPATLRIFGCTMDDIIGKTPIFFSPLYQADGILSSERAIELIKLALNGISQRFEWKHQRLDGTSFDAEISLNRIEFDRQILLQAIVRDISGRKKAEETIFMLAHAIRSISECVSITDIEDKIIFVNSAFLKTYQYEESELIGKSVKIVQSQNNARSVLEEILPSTLNGGWQGELLNRRKDGSEFPVFLSTSIIYDEMVNPVAIIGVATNITKRKQEEEAMRISEEKYRTIFENVHDVFFQIDFSGIVQEISPSIKYFSEFDRDEIIGKPVANLYYNPEDRMHLLDEIIKKGDISDYQLMLKTKSGNVKYASVNARLISKADGPFSHIAGSIRDITERRKAESELESERSLLRTLVDLLPELIYVKDNESRFIMANQACATYMDVQSPMELIGKSDEDFYIHEDAARFYSDELKVLEGIPIYEKEEEGLYPTGKRLSMQTTKVPIRDSNGKIFGFVGTSHDITERKKAEFELIHAKEKAEESDRLKTAFMNNISHEIRTPLSGIVGFGTLITQPDILQEEKEEYLDILNKSSTRLINTINDYMDISLIVSGNMPVNLRPVNCLSLVQTLEYQFHESCKEKNLELKMEYSAESEDFTLTTDEDLLYKSLVHLLNNAVKFTPSGTISFGYKLKKERLEFFVKDTGIGIDPDAQKQITEVFMQEDVSSKRAFEGNGLGLSITSGLIKLLGGRMKIKSEKLHGTKVTINLPVRVSIKEGSEPVETIL